MDQPLEYQIERTRRLGESKQVAFDVEEWERNVILQMRLAAREGRLVVCDPDSHCWWTTGKMQCNKENRELSFNG